jgi:hypothetical protein
VALSTVPDSLKKFFSDPNIPKILHDSRRDVEALQFQFGVAVKNIVDTQVLFGLVTKLQTAATNGTSGPRIGLNELLEKYNLGGMVHSDIVSKRMNKVSQREEERSEGKKKAREISKRTREEGNRE